MKAVVDSTQGDRFNFTSLDAIAPAIGVSKEEAGSIAQYLVDQGLIEWAAFGGIIAITHLGIREMEQAEREPEIPTRYLPPFNVIHIEHMTNSMVQQGTNQSVQYLSQPVLAAETSDLAGFLRGVRLRKADLGLAAEAEADLDAQLATLDAQMKSPRPKRVVLTAAGGVLVEILKSASSAAAGELVKQLPAILR